MLGALIRAARGTRYTEEVVNSTEGFLEEVPFELGFVCVCVCVCVCVSQGIWSSWARDQIQATIVTYAVAVATLGP